MLVQPVREWVPSGEPYAPPQPPVPPEETEDNGPLKANWFGAQAWMRRDREPTPPWTPVKVAAAVLLWAALGLLLVGIVFSGVLFATGGLDDPGAFSAGELAFGAVLNMVWFVVPPVLYVAAFYRGAWSGLKRRLLLRSDNVLRDIGIGVAAALGFVLLGIGASLALAALGASTENPVVEGFGPALTWPVIVLIAISSGVSEELLFRGYLQGRFGIVPANIVFGFAHLDYGVPIQVFLPMALGFLFSWLMLRTRSIWPPIIAHAGFNFIMLTLTKLAYDFGWEATILV